MSKFENRLLGGIVLSFRTFKVRKRAFEARQKIFNVKFGAVTKSYVCTKKFSCST